MNEEALTTEALRRALEALRNGVPNRDAVRVLGCGQGAAIERFRDQLSAVDATARDDNQAKGMLVSGDFGSGKSHLLRYLEHVALGERFVCSHIVISKETPLYDSAKLFLAAVEAAVAQDVTGNVIQEIALKLREKSPAYVEFFQWADREDGEVSSLFPATLLLHDRLNNDPELSEKVRAFWAGEKLPIAEVRAGMRQIGMASTYQLRTVAAKELPLQRFKFISRLIRAAGYRGWVLLIDEVELVGQYSRLQRGRSYAELARWLGNVEADQYPGLTAVAAITTDFDAKVFQEKGDAEYVVPFLQGRETDEFRTLASRAETGMRLIKRESVPLVLPDQDLLNRTYDTLKSAHAAAYDWDPPEFPVGEPSLTRPMRTYVRRWINEWDLRRLYPSESLSIEENELQIDYTENPELQQPVDDSPGVA